MNTKFYNYLLAVLTSITIALGIRIVGTMLISSLIVFPTVTALQVSKGFRMTILIATVISVVCVVLGVFISFAYNLPTGAVIVLMNAIAFALAFLFKALRR
jgi:zinc transport system permease protein